MDLLGYHIQNPEAYLLLLLLPILVVDYIYNLKKRKSTIKFPSLALAKKASRSYRVKFRHIVPLFRALALVCFIIALSRPQQGVEMEHTNTEGIDIMLALDVSGSMAILDMMSYQESKKLSVLNAEKMYKSGQFWQYSRLGYAKTVIADFIKKRKHDRIGLSVFAGNALTLCPLTSDYGSLIGILSTVNDSSTSKGGTAIGDGLMASLARLEKSEAKSKVLILLTDGQDNSSLVPPMQAAKIAKALGVKVYTIGVGKSTGKALDFQHNPWTGELSWVEQEIRPEDGIDAVMLKELAEMTGGMFFHAENKTDLENIYEELNQLEKTEVETIIYSRYSEKFYPWLLIGALFILLEIVLANTRFVRIP